MRIVFFGTPDFALESLRACVESGHEVVAVVTQPDRERDRRKVTYSPVKQLALELGLKVLQYEKVSREGVEELGALKADLFVTCAFGQILSQKILDIPPLGTINVHGSLLPKYRGSAPIQWAIINGDEITGITIMRTALKVDSGDILIQESTPIGKEETAGELFDRLAVMGGELLKKALALISSGKAVYTPQEEEKAVHCRMLGKSDGLLDFSLGAKQLDCLIRGLTPWPSAFTKLEGKTLKILKAAPCGRKGVPGCVTVESGGVYVGCGSGSLQVLEVQLEGGKKMDISAFMLGHKLNGVKLG